LLTIMTHLLDPESVVPPHLVDEDLLAYLDGELPGEAQQDAIHHLERCWDCRTRLAATQARIESFMQVRRSLLPQALPPSEPAVAAFQQRLGEHSAAISAGAHYPRACIFAARVRALAWLVPSSPRPAFAVLAIAAAAVVAFMTWFNAPLSADAVLARAEVQEMGSARGSNAVVKNVIQIDRIDSKTGQRERLSVLATLADNASPAMSISLGTPDGALEQDVLSGDEQLLLRISARVTFGQSFARYAVSQHWVPGVSVLEYRKLISDRGLDHAFVERTGGFVELRHPFRAGHPSGLLETRLQLDARTWIPTEIRILGVENGVLQEYRLTRTEVEFLARTEELAALFASVGSSRSPTLEDPERRVEPLVVPRLRPLPLSYSDSVATPAEVAVAVALHEASADLGEEINVFQMSDGSLLVQGLLDRVRRKQQIETALRTVTGALRVELYTVGQRNPGTDLFEAPWRSSMATGMPLPAPGQSPIRVADFSGATMPMYEPLHAYFVLRARSRGSEAVQSEIDKAIAAWVTDVVRRSTDALFHAWALRKLELQFAERRVQSLPATSRVHIDRLRRSHQDQLGTNTRQLAAMLEEVAPQEVPEPGQSVAPPDTRGDDRDNPQMLLRLVSEQNQLIRSLFTASAGAADPASGLVRLRTVLRQLEPGS